MDNFKNIVMKTTSYYMQRTFRVKVIELCLVITVPCFLLSSEITLNAQAWTGGIGKRKSGLYAYMLQIISKTYIYLFLYPTPLEVQVYIKFVWTYATLKKRYSRSVFYCTEACLSVTPFCCFVFYLSAAIFKKFWLNLVLCGILTQGRPLLKIVRVESLFRLLPF